MQEILICALDEINIPQKHSAEAVGRDLKNVESFTIAAGEIKLISSGVKIFLPLGRSARIVTRSGLPLKTGLLLANSIGIIDSDYRGEYLMQLYNPSKETITISAGTRLCQVFFEPNWAQIQLPISFPQIKTLIDEKIYQTFEQHYPSQRGS